MKRIHLFSSAFTLFAATVILLTGTTATADRFGDDAPNFVENIREAAIAEDTTQIVHSKTPQVVQSKLEKIAFAQAQIWGDTILEGDYYAENEISLDEIEGIYRGRGELVAYRITYSAKSWMTAECEFDRRSSHGPGTTRLSPNFRIKTPVLDRYFN